MEGAKSGEGSALAGLGLMDRGVGEGREGAKKVIWTFVYDGDAVSKHFHFCLRFEIVAYPLSLSRGNLASFTARDQDQSNSSVSHPQEAVHICRINSSARIIHPVHVRTDMRILYEYSVEFFLSAMPISLLLERCCSLVVVIFG